MQRIEHENPIYKFSPPSNAERKISKYGEYLTSKTESILTPHLLQAFIELRDTTSQVKDIDDWFIDHADTATGEYRIYPDISGPQKRYTWLLINKLLRELKLNDSDLIAHEFVHVKVFTEGLVILDFYLTRKKYEENVRMLLDILVDNPNTFSKENQDVIKEAEKTLKVLEEEENFVLNEGDDSFKNDSSKRDIINNFYDKFYPLTSEIENLIIKDNGYESVSKLLEDMIKQFLIELQKSKR